MIRSLAAIAIAGCTAPTDDARLARIIDTLAEDNYGYARREPELVAMKLHKMQRGPYEWMRGTAALYWRDLMEPGQPRASTRFGNPASSRVLLVGDAHVENVGTFRASDGTMFVDWNDFDATGYGPFGADLRRLATALAIVSELGAAGDAVFAADLAREVTEGYVEAIAILARGDRIGTLGLGAHPLFDDEIDKAQSRGDRQYALDELAPVGVNGRAAVLGDLEAAGDDGVIEDRVIAVDAEQAAWLALAVDQWRRREPAAGALRIAVRRIGSGVASFPVLRFQVVLDGPTDAPEDDVLLELKETRDGVIVRGVPILQAAEWTSPAARAVDTQRRLQARPDADARLDAARVGGLSLKIRDREAYQRGVDAGDLVDLASEAPDELRRLARLYGGLLGRAHGGALTADGVAGYAAIYPVVAGNEAELADEVAALAAADAAQIFADHSLVEDVDLARFVAPGAAP